MRSLVTIFWISIAILRYCTTDDPEFLKCYLCVVQCDHPIMEENCSEYGATHNMCYTTNVFVRRMNVT